MPQKRNLKIIQTLVQSFLERETGQTIASPRTDLVKKGIISSLTMFELIDFIEKKFKIKVDVLSVNPDNFNTLEEIANQIIVWTSK